MILLDGHLFQEIYNFETEDKKYSIVPLDKSSLEVHIDSLLEIHKLIPFVTWTREDFFAEHTDARVYYNKWQLSIMIMDIEEKPIGFLVAYFRQDSPSHPFESVYLHRMAIKRKFQRRGIGKFVLRTYVDSLFLKINNINYVTLQTNDTIENLGIIKLYEDLGFKKVRRIYYPQKTDWLFVFEKTSK